MKVIKEYSFEIMSTVDLKKDVTKTFRDLSIRGDSQVITGPSRYNESGVIDIDAIAGSEALPGSLDEIKAAIDRRVEVLRVRAGVEDREEFVSDAARVRVQLNPWLTGSSVWLLRDDEGIVQRREAIRRLFAEVLRVHRKYADTESLVAWALQWDLKYPMLVFYLMPRLSLREVWTNSFVDEKMQALQAGLLERSEVEWDVNIDDILSMKPALPESMIKLRK